MARFTLPRDLYHGKGALKALKTFKGKKAIICVGGGIGHEKETLLEPLRQHVRRERYSMYSSKQTRICSAELGNDAGVIGAALLDHCRCGCGQLLPVGS